MRSRETRIHLSRRLHDPSRVDGRFLLASMIVFFAIAAVLVYFYVPIPFPSDKKELSTEARNSSSPIDVEESAIKKVLIDYVHAMLLEEPNHYKTLFTGNFAKNDGNVRTMMPKATSVQISQPAISITSPTDARVRFNQIVRTSDDSRHSQERLLLTRTSATDWRIDRRASQPIMNSNSHTSVTPATQNSFLYIKSEKEKQGDTQQIKELIQFWADARAEADIEGVVTSYRRDMWERKGITKEQWLEDFREPKNVTITNVNVVFPGQNLAEVTLTEKIEDDNKRAYFDIHLSLQLSDDGWLIADENSKLVSEQILRPIIPSPLESIVKAQPITEPKPVPHTSTNAKVETATAVETAFDTTVKPAGTKRAEVSEAATLRNLVLQWKEAWSSKDVDTYLGYYSEKFEPKSGMDIEQWRRYRRVRLGKPATIEIQINNMEIDQKNGNSALVSFVQQYKSDLYQDKTRKTLSLVRENEGWKILREYTSPI